MSESGSDHVVDDTVEEISREGLPREYRMRADRHYVDQLASSSSGQPVRMIPVTALDGADAFPPSSGTLRQLIESIRRHGIVHPLLVRRQDARYAVIAGRKRLAAAATLRLAAVPCLVHDVTEAEATVLAEADNLRATGTDIRLPAERESSADRAYGDEALLGTLAAKAWTELPQGEIKLERQPDASRLTVVIGRGSKP